MPSLYFAHQRAVFDRDGMTLAASPYLSLLPGEHVEERLIRFRTIGDMTCTGAVASSATTVAEIIAELASSRVTERGHAPTTSGPRRPWKTAKSRGISSLQLHEG